MVEKSEDRRRTRSGNSAADGERRCVVTGALHPRAEMIRFVKGPDGRLVADFDGRLPGRGLWLTASRAALAQAASGRHFARALKGPVEVPGDLVAQVESGLVARARNVIGLARRAGCAVAGFEKTRGELKRGAAHLLIAARDAAADGRGKLVALAPGLGSATGLDAAELGQVFGRESVVHVAVTDPGFAARVSAALARLEGVRGAGDGEDAIPGGAKLG